MKRLNWLAGPFAVALALGLGACGGGGMNSKKVDAAGGGQSDGGGGQSDGGGGGQADGSSGATFTLAFSGSGYGGPHGGQTMHFALWDDANTTEAVLTDSTTVPQGGGTKLEMTWDGALTEGHSYALYYYADVNGNDACDGPSLGEDHAWKEEIASVTGDVELTPTHNTNFTGDCSKF